MSDWLEHEPTGNLVRSTTPQEEFNLEGDGGTANRGEFTHRSMPAESDLALAPKESLSQEPQPPLFHSWSQPQIPPPTRIPNLGHLCLLAVLIFLGLSGASVLAWTALHFHLFGVRTIDQANTDIHYTLGTQVATYLITFGLSLLIFPRIWHEGFFTGLQWNGATALRLRGMLFAAAGFCFALAIVDQWLLPGPADAPIDKLFETRTSAWLLFAFGVTFAPFFEEILFRGFLLPSLCTAYDWAVEQFTHTVARPLDHNGYPQWSFPAMAVGSIVTSIPFALIHAEQTAHALGPFFLLVAVSLALCWVRLASRSLAASVLVHTSYNLLLFSIMLVATGGFQHLEKM
jgi:uncharacterized protein